MLKFDRTLHLTTEQVDKIIKKWPATLNLAKVSRHFDVRVFDGAVCDHVEHASVSTIVIHQSSLYIDGRAVANVAFGRNFVRFCHKSPDRFVSGVLNFTPDGMAFTGDLFLGATEMVAQAHSVAGTVPPTVFKTRIAKTGAVPTGSQAFPAWCPPEPGDNDASQWEAGFDLILGYKFGESGTLPSQVVELRSPDKPDDPADLSESVSLSADPKTENLLVSLVTADAGAGVDAYGRNFPGAFTFEVAWDGASFRGTLQRFDQETGMPETTQLAWHGTAATAKTAAAVAASAAPVAVSLPSALSDVELFGLQADSKTLQDYQYAMLIENMKWALANDDATKTWVPTYFGEVAPNLDKTRTDLINQDKSFYTDRFAVTYLGTSFNKMSGPGAPGTKLNTAQTTNLEFYMRAGLAYEKSYSMQSQGVFLQAFIQALPRLGDYIADQDSKDPNRDWATRLYNRITDPNVLNMTVLKIIGNHEMAEANRHSTILMALQPSGDLASKYYTLINNALLGRAFEHLNLDSHDAVQSWMEDSIRAFINAFLLHQVKLDGMDPDTKAKLYAQAQDMQQAALEAGSMAQLAGALTDLVIAAKGKDFWEKLANANTAIGKAGYRFAQSIYVMALFGGLISAITAFMKWDKLTADQRTTAVMSVIQTVAIIVKNVNELVSGMKGFNSTQKVLRGVTTPEVGGYTAETESSPLLLSDDEESISSYGTKSTSELLDMETNTIKVEGTTWAKTFSESVGKLCEGIAVIVSVWFALDSLNQFINDFSSGASLKTKVLDGIMMAANIGVAVCAVAGLFFAGTMIPVIGAIFAIVGIIATLIEMFWPPEQPPSPVETFMRTRMVPAVAGDKHWILDAPKDWSSSQTIPIHHAYNPEKAGAVA